MFISRTIKCFRCLSCLRRRAGWPYIGIAIIVGLALGLRFWQLGRFDALVFDEVYFVNFAERYRQGIAPLDAHPPLGKYIIAASIQIATWLKFDSETTAIGGSPFGYRQANALFGSLIPVVVIYLSHTIAGQSSRLKTAHQWIFALMSGLFVSIDGLFIVESRYALLNVYVVFFGLLSHCLWLKKLPVASGVSLGMAIATKWNGLGYLLSLVIWETHRAIARKSLSRQQKDKTRESTAKKLTMLVLIAFLTYSLIWWPHLYLVKENIFSVHAYLIQFHQQIGAGGHSACSKWYSWPLLIRPITYWYSSTHSQSYTVSNLGNPALWLFSTSAIFLLSINFLLQAKRSLLNRLSTAKSAPRSTALPTSANQPINGNLAAYLAIAYLCDWIPWLVVQRCTFNYLYMPAAIFSFMALAYLLSIWLTSPAKAHRVSASIVLSLIAIAFIFWLPLTLGLPLSFEQLQNRWLLKSWI